jgi:hypothetical protein
MTGDQFPLLFYFMVLDGDTPCAWSPFRSKTMSKIGEEIYDVKSVHPTLQKQIKLRMLCEKYDKVDKGPYARTIGCVIDGEDLGGAKYKGFKAQYKRFLGKAVTSNNAIREAHGFRLIIVQGKQMDASDAQLADDVGLDDETLDDLAQMTKFHLKLSGRGFIYDFIREERRFRQVANAVLAEIRSNENLPEILADDEV